MATIVHKIFFARYQKIIALVYGAVTLAAIMLFSFLYSDNYEANIRALNLRLVEHKQSFNSLLRVRYDAVKSLQRQSRNFLNEDYKFFDSDAKIKNNVEKDLYFLDIQGHSEDMPGSVVGMGQREKISQDVWRELQMVFSLNPLIGVLKNSIKSLEMVHYTSKNKFMMRYPFAEKNKVKFDLSTYDSEYYRRSLPSQNREDKLFWTDLYYSTGTHKLIFTAAAPVYRASEYRGVVAIDFSLLSFEIYFSSLKYSSGRVFLVNDFDTVLYPREKGNVKKITVGDVLPDDLKRINLKNLKDSSLTEVGKYWVFVGDTSYAPWRVVYYTRTMDVALQTLKNIMPSLALVIIFTTLFLIGADRLISKEFIEPASFLVDHILNQGLRLDGRDDEMKEPWKSWFDAVTNVFSENRALVQKLEGHIDLLDDEVSQRTKELSKRNKLLEKALEDLKKAQNQIITQEKLAGLGALTAGIAHEIRNPLNFIVNFADTSRIFSNELIELAKTALRNDRGSDVEEFEHLTEQLKKNMEKIEYHGRRADSIVRSMLSHARGEDEEMRLSDINDLLNESYLLTMTSFKQQGFLPETLWELDKNIPNVWIYNQNLGRVFLNIFNNAFYVLRERSLKDSNFHPQLKITSQLTNQGIEISIRDNGPGLSKHTRKKIFDPFFTTKPSGEGTGLGLSLSYNIVVDQHHGSLIVDSEHGIYTEFSIVIPTDLEKVVDHA